MYTCDALDLDILSALEENARVPVSELSRRLGVPHSTVRDRIRAMEDEGIILGYGVRLDPAKLGLGIQVIIQTSRDQSVKPRDFMQRLSEFPEVTRVQLLSGDTDENVTLYVRDVEHLKQMIYDRVGQLDGLASSSTALVMEERTFPLTRQLRNPDSQGD